MYRVSPFVSTFATALLGGALLATVWVNLAPASYYDAIEFRLLDIDLPHWVAALPVSLTPFLLVSHVLMPLFLFFIGKELWEALVLERGELQGTQALLPLGLTLGGLAGAALMWLVVGTLIETAEEASFGTGWTVPLASDVTLAYLIGLRAFGRGHTALHLLLLLTIAADIAALVIVGLTLPDLSPRLLWLVLPLAASVGVWALYGRRPPPDASERRRRATLLLWPYALAGLLSWVGIAASGLPPALGLLPVIPAIAHADRTFGLFAEAEAYLRDPLNRLAHILVRPLAVVLFFFGLTRGGVDLHAFAPTTVTLLASVWLGRPLGMLLGGVGLALALRLRLPAGVTLRDLILIALIMGMGFTVPILSLDLALPGGAMQEAARLGLAISLLAGPAAILLARRIRPTDATMPPA
ncbi:Na+/H+ antiporter NhaA [Tabrizicola sp. BL-A-41-H6]|uniref:Na+/H+ antiporter NhaA n=1 Tax=Tabrizicola sp. BL-A-41-H6 TaxID=3421107 RepID=UPI003D66CBDC